MEERNLEFDDDGKIRVRRRTDVPEGQEEEDADELIIDVPGFKEFEEGGEEPDSALFDEVCRAQEEAEAGSARAVRTGGSAVCAGRCGRRGGEIPRQRRKIRRRLAAVVRRRARADERPDRPFGHL